MPTLCCQRQLSLSYMMCIFGLLELSNIICFFLIRVLSLILCEKKKKYKLRLGTHGPPFNGKISLVTIYVLERNRTLINHNTKRQGYTIITGDIGKINKLNVIQTSQLVYASLSLYLRVMFNVWLNDFLSLETCINISINCYFISLKC